MMVAACLLGAGSSLTARADGGVVLKLHYHREDGEYDNWAAWLWTEGGEGGEYPFEEEDGEMVATMDVPDGATKIGFIVKTPDWEKDIAEDQFLDISEVVSGTVHAYVESGVEGAVKEYGEDVMVGTKVKGASYDGKTKITLELTGEIDEALLDTFYVKGRLGEVKVTNAELADKASDTEYFYDLTIESELDPYRNYRPASPLWPGWTRPTTL